MSVISEPEAVAADGPGEPAFAVEQAPRLSASMLWDLQRRFFEGQGIDAWRSGVVPSYVTSNPLMANAYARLVLTHLRDGLRSGAVDPGQVVYIIELGAGCGRFAFHFLRQFDQLRRHPELDDLQVTYVMTDLARQNIDFWRAHPSFQQTIEAGRLDFASYSARQVDPLELIVSGASLSPETVRNPVVVIANYFFDCIPHDVFTVRDGRLLEGRPTVASQHHEADLSDPDLLHRIEVTYDFEPAPDDPYPDPDVNGILGDYRRECAEGPVLFPVAALECLRYFHGLSGGRAMVLCADKGFHWKDDLLLWGEPGMALHGGCFSMMVNFDSLTRYVERLGGHSTFASRRYSSLSIGALFTGQRPEECASTFEAFAEVVERFGPDEYFNLIAGLEGRCDTIGGDEALSWLRFSRADVNVFLTLFPALVRVAQSASEQYQEDLFAVLSEIHANHYEIGEQQAVAFCIGTILYLMGYYPEARELLEEAARDGGPQTETLYNVSLCHYAVGQLDDAMACLDRLLDADPGCQPARALRTKIEGTLRRRYRG